MDHAADSDDLPDQLDRDQHTDGLDESENEELVSEDARDINTKVRAKSNSAAAAGPSSSAAAKAAFKRKGSKSQGRQTKKRAAAVAFQDAISLLPQNLDAELIVRIRQELKPRNRMQKQTLMDSYKQQYNQWRFYLRQHFSLLFYGFGSKRTLLEHFAGETLTDGGVMACDGLASNMSAKQVLQAVASALTHRSCRSHSHSELLSLICAEPSCRQLYVLVHNIDGPGLRASEEQLWLSRLSQAPCIRLVASVDHVNAPLLWNSRVAAAFNWLWVESTTYAAYEAETSNVAPIITSCKQSATKRGATTVLSTLVSSAREVFKVIAQQQLQDPSAAGVSFPALLRTVRAKFIMNTEHALKSVLAEFRDHELIKFRPGSDGGEVMYVPMEADGLRDALQGMQQADEAA